MNRWQLVQRLFDETVALDAPARARVLARHVRDGSGDDDLARSVEALVAAEATPLAALDGTAGDLWRALHDEPPAELLCGEAFGAYRVDEHLSTGGMGHVYRATRTSAGTERRVALKVLRPGLAGDAFPARFRRERETLAALEHEHVVAFLDAGALPDGRPFLAMEYVEGVPLTEWARGKPRRARIELFLQVLAAVRYAHEKLVVHRDLKPSNVLVTAQGAPKLLDFGVAAALEPDASASGSREPLTPTYASPEQLRGEPATTAADVYSLGLLLHELLTGELPAAGGPDARALDRDLAAIVRKAIEPDPADRYRSVDRLARDLRRHLAHEPVSARRGTPVYRATRFARRNRWSLALAGALASAAVAALAVGWIGSEVGRRRAEREASVGWGAHAQAKSAAHVFETWIASAAASDPALGADAIEHLERAVRHDLGELPEAETLVRLALARLCVEQGDEARATVHARRAWELVHTTRGIGQRDVERARALMERLEPGSTSAPVDVR